MEIHAIRLPQRYSETMSIELDRLQSAYRKTAALVVMDAMYLPVFERLEKEIAEFKRKDDALKRAQTILANYKEVA